MTSPIVESTVQRLIAPITRKRWIERPWFVFLLMCAALVLFTIVAGVAWGNDTRAYSVWGDRMLASRFNFVQWLDSFPPGRLYVFYVGFTTLIGAAKAVSAEYWDLVIICANILAVAAAVAILVQTVLRTTGSRTAGWCALGLSLLSFDLFNWTRFVLSDATFLSLNVGLFALVALHLTEVGSRRGAVTVLLLLFTVFYRATGVVLMVMVAAGLGLGRAATAGRPFGRRALTPGVVAILAIALVVSLSMTIYFVADPERWPFEWLAEMFRIQAAEYARGEIISARPETFSIRRLRTPSRSPGSSWIDSFTFSSSGRVISVLSTSW